MGEVLAMQCQSPSVTVPSSAWGQGRCRGVGKEREAMGKQMFLYLRLHEHSLEMVRKATTTMIKINRSIDFGILAAPLLFLSWVSCSRY